MSPIRAPRIVIWSAARRALATRASRKTPIISASAPLEERRRTTVIVEARFAQDAAERHLLAENPRLGSAG